MAATKGSNEPMTGTMNRSLRIYIALTVLTGIGLLLGLTLLHLDEVLPVITGILFLAVLAVIAESQGIAIDNDKAISISFAINISALLLFGIVPAAWVSFATAFFAVVDAGQGRKSHLLNTPLYKVLLNAANYIISILACGIVFTLLGGDYLRHLDLTGFERILIAIAGMLPAILGGLIVYVFINTVIVMLYFAVQQPGSKSLLGDWFRIFSWSALSMLCVGALGVLLTVVYDAFGPLAVLLFFGPFMLFRYAYVGFSSIQKGYLDTIQAFSAALEAKDKYTVGHARRVERYCEIIARELDLSNDRTKVLKYASLLHDIGKIGISERILNKETRLTDEEYEEIKKHPVIGAQMLEGIEFLQREVRIIRAHHVHYDGSGYPRDCGEDAKLLEAQILCVADSFDAMTSDRAYRKAMTHEEAFTELLAHSGTQFMPEAVKALIHGLTREQAQAQKAAARQEALQ